MTREKQSFNLDLFPMDLEEAAKRRVANIDKLLNVRERVLIGCGRCVLAWNVKSDVFWMYPRITRI